MINFERALHWLQRRWWGLIVAHLIILVGTFSTIWVFIEPMGIPDSFGRLDDLPGLLRQRFFYHIVFTLLIGAYLTLILDLISRKKMKRLLVNRRELPRLEDMINGAKKEIWISGIALDRVSTLTGLLNLRIRDGVRLRLLALDPEIGNCN